MEISLEALIALSRKETVTVTIEDPKGEFTLTQSPKRFVIEAEDLRLEIGRNTGDGGFVAALQAWEIVSDFVGNWPEV